MPTMPERMAVVETKVEIIEKRTSAMDSKLDLLLARKNNEEGRTEQKRQSARFLSGLVAAVSAVAALLVNILFRAADTLAGGP